MIANSSWSATLLDRAGIPKKKLRVVPLAYRNGFPFDKSTRSYPEAFSAARPLNLLFLGQVNLRKGALELIEVMRRLENLPLQLDVVGPIEFGLQDNLKLPTNVKLIGPVARGAVEEHYCQADLLVLPTHSDGFAITQLEALARGLPVMASRHCGDVITDGENGRVIDAVTMDAIEAGLRWALDHPRALADMAAHAPARLRNYTPERVVDTLLEAVSSTQL